jgi:hypothetical protein
MRHYVLTATLVVWIAGSIGGADAELLSPHDAARQLDAALHADQQSVGVKPAASCDDSAFLRRAWLDLAGRVPPFLVARDFLKDDSPDKRARAIESLLASEEFAEHWGGQLTIMLTDRRPIRHETHDGRVLREYLQTALRTKRSYRDITSELITGSGLSDSSGPANFLLRYEVQSNQLAGAIAKQFLGVSLQCAECHDHPFERWTQDDFRGLQAFFAQTRRLEDDEADDYLRAVVDVRKGELEIDDPSDKPAEGEEPDKLKVAPLLLDGAVAEKGGTRRQMLASWVTGETNPYFARNLVNRVWSRIFSRGLVEPLDSLGADEPGPHAAALDQLGRGFAASGHDLRWLFRAILLSDTYQRETAASGESVADPPIHAQLSTFARFPARSLTVDELYQSIVQATGHTGVDEAAEAEQYEEDELAYADRPVEFLGERAQTVQRSLVLLNGSYVEDAVHYGARVTLAAQGRRDAKAQLEFAFLAALSRQPAPEEATKLLPLVQGSKGAQGLEDLWWLLLNSAEFSSNH